MCVFWRGLESGSYLWECGLNALYTLERTTSQENAGMLIFGNTCVSPGVCLLFIQSHSNSVFQVNGINHVFSTYV